jgi:formylglycine-generating enzyme required for sulfatase activity
VKYFEKATWEEANEICKNYSSDGYINWRLPSIEELEKIHKNIFTKEMKINDDSVYWNSDLIYWSSTLDSEVFVNCLKFKSGRRTTNYGKNNHFRFFLFR